MKRLLTLLASLLISTNVYAANSATALAAVPVSVGGCNNIIPVTVLLDTDADLTVYTPSSTRYAAVVGIFTSGGSLPNALTIKSASTTLAVWAQVTVAGNVAVPIGGPIIMTNKGEALIMRPTTGALNQMIVYVAECSKFIF